MPRLRLDEIHLGSVEDAVGVAAYCDGYSEMEEGAVRRLDWRAARRALHGVVQDTDGEWHETVVYFRPGSPMRFDRGYCSCETGCECRHSAALALAGALASGQDLRLIPAAPPPWEHSLAALLQPASQVRLSGAPGKLATDTARIAIELSLAGAAQPYGLRQVTGPPSLTVNARLVQPGARGSWVGGQLAWGRLEPRGLAAPLTRTQLRVLRELYWTFQAGDRLAGSFHSPYAYGGDKTLDLATFESRQLWSLLDEAESAGIALVYRKAGNVPRYGSAELFLDITRVQPSGELRIAPLVGIDGNDEQVWPLRFIGSDGHGLVYVDRAEAERTPDPALWRFRLATMVAPVPAQLQELALSRQPLAVPPADESRFREQFYPRLRQMASLISSDGSFSLPAVSAPTLVLTAAYGEDHELDVSWEWSYQVGDSLLRTRAELPAGSGGQPGISRELPAGSAGRAAIGAFDRDMPDEEQDRLVSLAQQRELETGYRDLEAEQDILATLDVPAGSLPGGRLTGMETVRFSTEVLPLLASRPGVEVQLSGDPADYREAGDSLRVEVSADELTGENDWYGLGVMVFVEDTQVPFADVFLALSRQQEYLLLPGGAYFSLNKPGLQALARLIAEARALQDLQTDTLRISRFQAGLWAELAELGIVSTQSQAWERQVSGLLSLASGSAGLETEIPLPSGLQAQLRPYQADGYQWLGFLWQHQLGGILADDMGLGKTVQTLALISHAREQDPDAPPFLIVAPTSVVSNWAAEAARFTPGLNVAVITDTVAKRRTRLADSIAGADAVVTTYTLLRLDAASYTAMPWSGLILDEAQYVKNHQSKIYQCARQVPAPVKLAITGTPMENNLMELWSLLSITAPGLFPHPDKFKEYYARPIERHRNGELLDQLRRRIRPLVKRRTKEQVAADLPAKQEQVLEVRLHPRHQKLYQMHLQRERQKVLGLLDDMDANRFAILRSLTMLRQLALHAGLVDPDHDDLPCAKLDTLTELLHDVIGAGHRALVFSQFTRFLERVRARLDDADIPYCYLDGRTRDRPLVIQRFKNGDVPVFLISLKAGGFGLNLTEADYCFLLDPWWNPATEAQAVDRTHRIGQTRNVVVYRLIAADTIEEKVMALKARKAALFSSVIDSGNAFGGALEAQDIRGLFD